jgi:hypothetical protein
MYISESSTGLSAVLEGRQRWCSLIVAAGGAAGEMEGSVIPYYGSVQFVEMGKLGALPWRMVSLWCSHS